MKNFGDSLAQVKGCFRSEEWATTYFNTARAYVAVVFIIMLQPNAFVARNISFLSFLISKVLRVRCYAQILPSIVGRVAVDMVNLVLGPLAGHVEPRETVSIAFYLVYANYPVAGIRTFSDHSCDGPRAIAATVRQSIKITSCGIVLQNLTQSILRKLGSLAIHEMGRPSVHTRLAIKNPLSGQTLSGFATLPQMAV